MIRFEKTDRGTVVAHVDQADFVLIGQLMLDAKEAGDIAAEYGMYPHKHIMRMEEWGKLLIEMGKADKINVVTASEE